MPSPTPSMMLARGQAPRLEALLEEAKDLIESKTFAENTQKAYAGDWRSFLTWCRDKQGLDEAQCFPTPSWLVVAWLMDNRESKKLSTLERALIAISHRHRGAGLESPVEEKEVRFTWRAIRREQGIRRQKRAAALPLPLLFKILDVQDRIVRPLMACRNKAIFAIGFFAGLRVSEIASIRIEHLQWEDQGLVLLIPKAKADQMGEGREIPIPYQRKGSGLPCVPSLVKDWMQRAGLWGENKTGFLWKRWGGSIHSMTDQEGCFSSSSIASLFKQSIKAIGEPPHKYSAHSLRAGVATWLAVQGIGERDIQEHLRHNDPKQTRKYIRIAERWTRSAILQVMEKGLA